MPLTVTQISMVNPRGGAQGTTVTVTGGEFGVAPGLVIFDPIGVSIPAPITSWVNDQIVFTVPAGLPDNRTLTLQIIRADNSDFDTVPFWVPAAVSGSNGLDYQYPSAEEGAVDQDVDDPRTATAADFNRLLDRLFGIDGVNLGVGAGMFVQRNGDKLEFKSLLGGGGLSITDLGDELLLTGGGGGGGSGDFVQNKHGVGTASPIANGQTDFTLSQLPFDPNDVEMYVNFVKYANGVQYVVVGTTLTWLNQFFLDAMDFVEIVFQPL